MLGCRCSVVEARRRKDTFVRDSFMKDLVEKDSVVRDSVVRARS